VLCSHDREPIPALHRGNSCPQLAYPPPRYLRQPSLTQCRLPSSASPMMTFPNDHRDPPRSRSRYDHWSILGFPLADVLLVCQGSIPAPNYLIQQKPIADHPRLDVRRREWVDVWKPGQQWNLRQNAPFLATVIFSCSDTAGTTRGTVLLAGDSPFRAGRWGWGRSKICNVDLSEVTATSVLDGDIAIENTNAWSIPRRSSAIRAQLLVEKTRMSVP
jgi:hypothetical protein